MANLKKFFSKNPLGKGLKKAALTIGDVYTGGAASKVAGVVGNIRKSGNKSNDNELVANTSTGNDKPGVIAWVKSHVYWVVGGAVALAGGLWFMFRKPKKGGYGRR